MERGRYRIHGWLVLGLDLLLPAASAFPLLDDTVARQSEGMVNLSNKRCKHPGCLRWPYYEFPGNTPKWCSFHKANGMIDVKNRRCQFDSCQHFASESGARFWVCFAVHDDGERLGSVTMAWASPWRLLSWICFTVRMTACRWRMPGLPGRDCEELVVRIAARRWRTSRLRSFVYQQLF